MPEEINDDVVAEMVKIGEKEYSQDDLQRLVGLGEIAVEAEQKYNTKIDKVWPDYGKTKSKVRELEEEVGRIRQEYEQNKQAQVPEAQDVAIQEAKEAARKLGMVLTEDFEEILSKNFRKQYAQERQAEKLLDEMDDLQGEINGRDGRPAFDKQEILEFMAENGYRRPMDAYEAKYKAQTDEWRAEQIIKSKRGTGFSTLETVGDKSPKPVAITDSNLSQMLRDVLNNG